MSRRRRSKRAAQVDWPGWCPICEKPVTFREYGPWHRDELLCTTCGSIPRQRALVMVLGMVRPDWRRERIWELAPAGPASDKLRNECAQYLASHYWPDVPLGTTVSGVQCEDFERPTLADDSIDVIVSSDVLEHVIDVDAAHAQAARILSDGGVHVWTVPQSPALEISRRRVRRLPDGLEYLEPVEYHGDPVNEKGALVTYDWGVDLPERVAAASGLWTVVFRLESRMLGLLGEFLEVFVSCQGRGALASAAGTSAATNDTHRQQTTAELQAVQAELAALQSSRSWQVTRPLRATAATFRRWLGRPRR